MIVCKRCWYVPTFLLADVSLWFLQDERVVKAVSARMIVFNSGTRSVAAPAPHYAATAAIVGASPYTQREAASPHAVQKSLLGAVHHPRNESRFSAPRGAPVVKPLTRNAVGAPLRMAWPEYRSKIPEVIGQVGSRIPLSEERIYRVQPHDVAVDSPARGATIQEASRITHEDSPVRGAEKVEPRSSSNYGIESAWPASQVSTTGGGQESAGGLDATVDISGKQVTPDPDGLDNSEEESELDVTNKLGHCGGAGVHPQDEARTLSEMTEALRAPGRDELQSMLGHKIMSAAFKDQLKDEMMGKMRTEFEDEMRALFNKMKAELRDEATEWMDRMREGALDEIDKQAQEITQRLDQLRDPLWSIAPSSPTSPVFRGSSRKEQEVTIDIF